ncbi:MAG: nucleotidyl transferase AbiEii/AbiGii toxin family protein [Acidobacteriota bacterium]|nr:nucleotidyl transferase AbiEii/AbiGii toxin family protein [Blastocatellia bacterium]MDW8241477.1 nucleotidyl transferase AbiEii/AbiGii toxin family protein [Acidobacteriota bacterium]
MNPKLTRWHKEVITTEAENAIKALRRKNLLSRFYLAGGTALALHFGHRKSADLDFFSQQPFNEEELLRNVQRLRKFLLVAKDRETLHTHIKGMKVSFLGYGYPLLFPLESFLGIQIADPRDIACMKISAIAGRGTRRDFVDLFVASQQYGLAHLMEAFKAKFASAHYNLIHVLKSLTFFEDAEKEPMPHMLIDLSWPEVKQLFTREVPRLLSHLK